ncbi:MAG: hypothetical protein U9R79_10640 [Armatimonadota bacterium]|nr:hypothetical protein [Armatimonadota bacterium]
MADERSGPSGPEQAQRDSRDATSPPPDVQPAQRPEVPESQTPGGLGGHSCIIIGLLAGCGCLALVVLVLTVFGGLAYLGITEEGEEAPREQIETVEPSLEIEQPEAGPTQKPTGEGDAPPAQKTASPGHAAAMDFARSRRSDWRATVAEHSGDWTTLTLHMAPPNSNWTTWLHLEWDSAAGRYVLIDEGPLAYEGEEEAIPEIYQPGEEVAKEAALGYVEEPDWVTKIVEHSADWRTVTVWVGPPASEWVYELRLTWNDSLDVYDLADVNEIPYP